MFDQRRLLSVLEAPWQDFHGLDGVALVLARCDRRVRRLHRQLGGILVILAADRILELAEAFTHRPPDLRQTLRTKQQQSKEQQEDDLAGSDVRHALRVAV